jgi:triphosphatase
MRIGCGRPDRIALPLQFDCRMGQQFELEFHGPAFSQGAGTAPRLALNIPALVAAEPAISGSLLRARAQKAQPSLLPPQAATHDAFRLTLVQCRWHIAANMIAAVESRDTEALHQLRVGLRRLRVALVSFGGEFRTPLSEAIKLRAKSLAHELAPARDLDVFVSELLEPAARANGSREAFAVLRARAETARRGAWNFAGAQIRGPRFRMFMADISDLTDHGSWSLSLPRGKRASKNVFALEMPAREVAQRMLAHRMRQAGKCAKGLAALSTAERHELRIALKKLRYTAEFFAPFFDPREVRKFVSRLGRMQDVLGTLNDVAVAENILQSIISTGEPGNMRSDISYVAGIVYGWHLKRAAHNWRDAVKRWKEFADAREFWAPGAA